MKSFATVTLTLLIFSLASCNQPPHDLLSAQKSETWSLLGGESLDVNTDNDALQPDMMLNTRDYPVVAWEEEGQIFVKRWTGLSWRQLGDALNVDPANAASSPALVLNSGGRPIVTWSESIELEGDTDPAIVAKGWDGDSWVSYGAVASGSELHVNPDIALDAAGNPIISWSWQKQVGTQVYVKRWDGEVWQQLGDTLNLNPGALGDPVSAPFSSLATDSEGNPIVAWQEDGEVYVKQWDGDDWQQVGESLGTGSRPALVLDNADNPVVALSTDGDVVVYHWDGASWVQWGTTLSNATYFSLALIKGKPILAYVTTVGKRAVYISYWSGNAWLSLGTPGGLIRQDEKPALAVGARLYVAYSKMLPGDSEGDLEVKFRE